MQSLLESLPNYIHYDTTMKSYQDVHGITSITYDTIMRHQEVHGITSITSNTTMKSHQEFHEIMSISYHSHVSLTNHRFIKHNNLMPIFNQSWFMHLFIPSSSISSPITSYRIYKASYLTFLKQQTIQPLETCKYPTNFVNLA